MAHALERHTCQPVRCSEKKETTMYRAYFAHSMQVYKTPEAARALEILEGYYGKGQVLDPETLDWHKMYRDVGWCWDEVYRLVVAQCNEVVMLEHKGYIGRGQYSEAQKALGMGKNVWVLRGNNLLRVTSLTCVDHDWAVQFATVITAADVVLPHLRQICDEMLEDEGIDPSFMDDR